MFTRSFQPRAAIRLVVCLAAVAAFGAGALTSAASAQVPEGTPFVLRAIGDSVTAGFGYCGLVDPDCTNGPGQPYSLNERSVCTGGHYDDRCSSDKGDTTAHLPGTDGVPAISWAAQFAVREDIPDYINYAVTGSTPSQWDDNTPGGFYNFDQLLDDVLNAHPDLTLMTLGANPVLHEFYSNPRDIACVTLLTIEKVKSCARRELEKAGTMMHLEHVYEKLLSDRYHVFVMDYHTLAPGDRAEGVGEAHRVLPAAVQRRPSDPRRDQRDRASCGGKRGEQERRQRAEAPLRQLGAMARGGASMPRHDA